MNLGVVHKQLAQLIYEQLLKEKFETGEYQFWTSKS